jgi:hypothetical protein
VVCFVCGVSLDFVMTLDQFVSILEKDADPALVDAIKYWPTDTKLYMYLHNKQLTMMDEFKRLLEQHATKVD